MFLEFSKMHNMVSYDSNLLEKKNVDSMCSFKREPLSEFMYVCMSVCTLVDFSVLWSEIVMIYWKLVISCGAAEKNVLLA